MKRITVFLMSILAASIGQQVDIDLISTAFSTAGIDNFEIPKLEERVPYGNFFEDLSRTTQTLLNNIILELYRQARLQSLLEANSVASMSEQLRYHYESLEEPDVDYTNNLLNNLNDHLVKFLDLTCGQTDITYKNLPHLPPQLTSINYYNNYHPMNDLFLNLGTIVDRHLSNIYVAMQTFYSNGWREAREYLSDLQQQFRNQYLNSHLLKTIREAVLNVYENAAEIEKHVAPETWQRFHELGRRVKSLHKEVKTTIHSAKL